MPTLKVRWDDFESAFIIGSPDARYFLNLDTGETEYTSHMDGETVKSRILTKVKDGNFLEIPRSSLETALNEVTKFIDAQENDIAMRLRDGMLHHKSPFLGFNRAMGDDRELRRRWSTHRQAGIERRLLAFCQANDLTIDHERYRALLA